MSTSSPDPDTSALISQLEAARENGQLTADAVENIRAWLTETRYREYAGQVAEHISEGKWQALDDAFWTVIPFGTGGRRGRMYPIGSNAINDRTIGESAQGLADYVKQHREDEGELSCGIAYDTRHRSRHFAELCAGIMVAAGFKVYFLDDYRATPELSYLVRSKSCSCGIMVTASNNPPSDNAVKVYWSTGGQVCPPHDKGIIERVMNTDEIACTPFAEALANGDVVICTEETDKAYVAAVAQQSFQGPRDLKIIYSPLHGVGASAVCPALAAAGFQDVEVYEPHEEPSGDFPNVPGQVSNPENKQVFDDIIQHAKAVGGELIMASDPDCDRMGCAAPLTADTQGEWATLNGNQICSVLTDYVLEQSQANGRVSSDKYIIKTLVTTEMMRRIADSYGVQTSGNLLVGFKWIAQEIDRRGPENFIYGAEESHGYLCGSYVRDKDGAVASLLMAELVAKLKAEGKSLHEKLDDLYWQHGYHGENMRQVYMEGSEGMAAMQRLMNLIRENPPQSLGGKDVAQSRDYLQQTTTPLSGEPSPLDGPRDNLIILDLAEEGNYVAVRPSGTEPKVKFYLFAFTPAEQLFDLDESKEAAAAWFDAVDAELQALANSVA